MGLKKRVGSQPFAPTVFFKFRPYGTEFSKGLATSKVKLYANPRRFQSFKL